MNDDVMQALVNQDGSMMAELFMSTVDKERDGPVTEEDFVLQRGICYAPQFKQIPAGSPVAFHVLLPAAVVMVVSNVEPTSGPFLLWFTCCVPWMVSNCARVRVFVCDY